MASSTVSSLTASDALAGTELFYADGLASAVAADVKVTSTQIKTWTSSSPTLVTPTIGVAIGTSLALNGVTLGTNKLAVAGTGLFNLNAASAPTGATGTGVQLVGTDATVARFETDSFGAIGAFTIRRANGTGASPTALASSDQIGAFNFHGYYVTGGPGYSSVQASVGALATQNWTSANQGTQLLLRTTPDNSTTLTTAMTIGQDQSVAMAGTSTIATSLAIGGATIGTNALAVTGTANISGNTTLGSSALLLWSTDVNINRAAAGQLNIGTTTANASGFLLANGAAFNGTNAAGVDIGFQRPSITIGSSSFIGWSSATPTSAPDVVISRNAAGVIQFGTNAANAAGGWLAAKGTLTGGTLADQGHPFVITATQPASPSTEQDAILWTITSAGSASQVNVGLYLNYAAGYTGSSNSTGINVDNSAAGTAAVLIPASGTPSGNVGLSGTSLATTTGTNMGQMGFARGGSVNSGLVGVSNTNKAGALNIGVSGAGINAGGGGALQIGGFFSLNQTTVPAVSAGLIADNGAQTDAIFLGRDNNSTVFTIADGGAVTSTSTIKTGGYTVATLPAAGTAGRMAYVTDALAPSFLTTVVGGGAVVAPVFDNGTNWVGA